MKRIQHELVQGTPEWHAFRAEHDGASEAAAMLGLSKYMTRSELLRIKANALTPEVDSSLQSLFDLGHKAEAAARPMAESILVDELYPATYSFGRLSASCDGLTMEGTTSWEHKLWNAELAAAIKRGELPDAHQPQCQQNMLVTGAEQILFMVSDGTPENCEYIFVRPDPAWQARIIAGWKQFNEDLANYQPAEVIPAAVAAPTMALPALSIQVTGSIALVDNLKVFGERLESFIAAIDKNPSDDQAFADAEAAIKTLGTAETALEAAKSSALAQTSSIDEMVRTVKLYADQAKTTRLMLEKLVKSRKDSIRIEIVQGGKDALRDHINMLNKRLGKAYMVVPPADFAAAIKGKRTIASLHDAVDTLLAQSKIDANATADKIQINLKSLDTLAADFGFLFNDLSALIQMDEAAFDAIVVNRVRAHKDAEAERIEAERAKIRAEEQAKLQREQAEKERKEKAEAEARERADFAAAAALIEKELPAMAQPAAAAQTPCTYDEDKSVATPLKGSAPPASTGEDSGSTSTLVPAQSAPAATPRRPSNIQIIEAIAHAFSVSNETAYGWIVESFSNKQRAA